MRRFLFHLLPQTLRFLNNGIFDRAEFFLLGERIVLAVIDRSNAIGKRDYAMLLLAVLLGMRRETQLR